MFNTREYRTVAFESPLDIMSIMDIERYKTTLSTNNKMRTEQVMHLLNIAYSADQDNYQDALTTYAYWKTWNINFLEDKLFFYRGSSTNVDVANSVKFEVLFDGRVVYTVTFYTPSTSKQSTDSTSNPLSLNPTNQPSFT
jgi:hypothetical protein